MRCEHARQLFNSYVDGELSPDLATELGAHRVQCPDCRQALALMEVSGHIISSDSDTVTLPRDFSNRLLACMDAPQHRRSARLRYALYFSGPLAAAAVVALAFLGVFDKKTTEVAGCKEIRTESLAPDTSDLETARATSQARREAEQFLEQWIVDTQKNYETKRQSGESLQQALDLTVGQWLDMLEKAKDTSSPEDHFPGADATREHAEGDRSPIDRSEIVD